MTGIEPKTSIRWRFIRHRVESGAAICAAVIGMLLCDCRGTTSILLANGTGGTATTGGATSSVTAGIGTSGAVTGSATSGAGTTGGGSTSAGSTGGTTGHASTTGSSLGGVCVDAGSIDAGVVTYVPYAFQVVYPEFELCRSNDACQCPQSCVPDPTYPMFTGLDAGWPYTLCEFGCQQTSDCPNPATICVNGNCVENFCGALVLGSPAPGAIGLPCNAQDAGSGTCAPVNYLGAAYYGLCVQGGMVPPGGACVYLLYDAYPYPEQNCAQGSFCALSSTVGGDGTCFTMGPGGCLVDYAVSKGSPNNELVGCGTTFPCQCPSICREWSVFGDTPACQSPCASDDNCPLAIEGCGSNYGDCPHGLGFQSCDIDASFCSWRECGQDRFGHPLPGTLNGDCAPMDAGGNCMPRSLRVGGIFGNCTFTGDAGAGDPCDPLFGKGNPSLLCGSRLNCLSGALGGGSVCEPLCDPFGDAGCSGPNEQCSYSLGPYCCLPPGASCTLTQACCFGPCDGGFCP
jgi:hypothetical protein